MARLTVFMHAFCHPCIENLLKGPDYGPISKLLDTGLIILVQILVWFIMLLNIIKSRVNITHLIDLGSVIWMFRSMTSVYEMLLGTL